MEELIGKIEGEGADEQAPKPTIASGPEKRRRSHIEESLRSGTSSVQGNDRDIPEDRLDRYIGNNFLRSLTMEVEGLKQSMDDLTDEEEMSISSLSAKSPGDSNTPMSSTTFGSTLSAPKDLRLLHPPPMHISMLCNFYIENVDPMFKVLHVPTLRAMVSDAVANVDSIPSGTHVEALLFAMYYSAITSLTPDESLQHFHDGKESLLAKYKAGTERALSNANFLTECDLETLQALSILLITVRANDNSLYGWTMLSVAVRLAHFLGLHREGSRSGLSPFDQEQRRRLWWGIINLDVRCSEDLGTDPMILEPSFNTKRPANINDSDMDPQSKQPILERTGFTEMSKCRLSHDISRLLWQIGYLPPTKEGEEPYVVSVEQKMKILIEIERHIEVNTLVHCDPSIPVAWATSVVGQLIIRRLRLAIYHPLQYGSQRTERPNVPREVLLKTSVETLELTHLLDTEPVAEKWRWFFKTYVQWHALAATLAELCIETKGQLVERAWRIVDVVFDSWADRIADSPNGKLWRPIRKLKHKASTVRKETQIASSSANMSEQLPLPYFGTPAVTNLQAPVIKATSWQTTTDPVFDPNFSLSVAPTPSNDIPAANLAALNVDESTDSINWAEWDEFMQDYQMDTGQAGGTSAIPMT